MNQSRLRTVLSLAAISLCFALAIPPARAMTPQQSAQLFVQAASGKNPAALQSLQAAANNGDANAQYELGFLYAQGQGVPRDDAQAASWWRKAADQGADFAQYGLGLMYQFGQGVPQDYAIAYALFNLAAVSTMQASTNRDRISQQMSEADIESGQNLTRMMQSLGITAAINAYANK